jgi:hypothetical protein
MPQLAGIDDQVEQLFQPLADFVGIGQRRLVAGQDQGRGQQGSSSSSSRASAIG